MPIYVKKIEHRSDITAFFIHLRYQLMLSFHPDYEFADYVSYETFGPSFTAKECTAYDKVMNDSHVWCQKYGHDIYRIALEVGQFCDFLAGYKRISDKREMKKFAREFIDANYSIKKTRALHTYGGCFWIEEFTHKGAPMFQCIIENTNPFADTLREMEIVLFDWMEKDVPHILKEKHAYPSVIRSRTDIIGFFAYLHLDRSVAYHPDDSFGGYINGGTREPTFTKRECKRFDQLMDDAHLWCQSHKEDIYELGMAVNDFFDSHTRLTDQKKIDAHYRNFIIPSHEQSYDLIALHVYQDRYWIEEMEINGKPFFQTALGDVNPGSTNLRDLEIDLFDSRKYQFLQSRRPWKDWLRRGIRRIHRLAEW